MKNKSKIEKFAAVAAALMLWHLASVSIGEEVLLVSPLKVLVRLSELVFEKEFYAAVGFSFVRITGGFILAVIIGTLLAISAYRWHIVEIFLWPYISVIKATPVASFIILCLIWLSSSSLPIFISFLMGLPIIYTNMLGGFKNTDKKMLEMAEIFRFSFGKKLIYIYLPAIKSHFINACSVALGLTWNAGIAAEIIGIPDGSMGEMLYSAKLYLATSDLFSWTVTIVCISIVFEKLFMKLINKLFDILED
ncbi:MAG: ABC transporter permease subunit, partial [Oscillospiraceae bacterium]|nr:ABC transporter permease subunit [Oscillospiraceae bacterium]